MNQRGFTLMELLIAITIFAIIGLASYHVLNTVSDTQQAMDERSSSLRQLQKAAVIIKKDFLQIQNRSIRSEYGDTLPSLTTTGFYPIELSHIGWRNPAGLARSEVQRVAYEIKDHQLIRYYWNVLDRAQDSKPFTQILLNGVDEIKFRFLDVKKQWHDNWPLSTNVNDEEQKKIAALPIAIEIVIKTTLYGELRWLYVVGDADDAQINAP